MRVKPLKLLLHCMKKEIFSLLVNVSPQFHIDMPRYVFRAKITHKKKTLKKMKGAVRVGDIKFT